MFLMNKTTKLSSSHFNNDKNTLLTSVLKSGSDNKSEKSALHGLIGSTGGWIGWYDK